MLYAKRAGFDDDESHLPIYWKGVDAGMKYAKEHVMVRVVQGHVLTDIDAAGYILGWLDGQNSHSCGEPLVTMPHPLFGYDKGFSDGYSAPPETLPRNVTG